MGRIVSLELNLEDLPDTEAEALRLALEKTNFFSLPENLAMKPVPDEIQYSITVETEDIVHSVRTSDTSAPPALHSLIQELSQLARTRRSS